MISYWIVGVLYQNDEIRGETSVAVAWSGRKTNEFQPFKREPMTNGRAKYVPIEDNLDLLPYGYRSSKNAREAIALLLAKGEGFTPMRGIESLTVLPVLYGSMGSFASYWEVDTPSSRIPHGDSL